MTKKNLLDIEGQAGRDNIESAQWVRIFLVAIEFIGCGLVEPTSQ